MPWETELRIGDNVRTTRMAAGYDDVIFKQHKAWKTARRFISFKDYKYIAQRWRFGEWSWPPSNWETAIQRCIKFGRWNHLA